MDARSAQIYAELDRRYEEFEARFAAVNQATGRKRKAMFASLLEYIAKEKVEIEQLRKQLGE